MMVHPLIPEGESRGLKASLSYIENFKARLGYMKVY